MIVAVCIFTGSYNHLRLSLAEAGLFLLELIPVAQEWAKAFYKSGAWLKCRAAYIAERIAIDGGLCEECKEELGYIVHHKILLTPGNINDPEIALNHEHLKYDCKRCHDYEEAHFVNKDDCRCRFDASGQPVEVSR